MARRTPIKSIQFPGFIGGLNTDADPYQLELNETPDCLNVDIGFRGAVSKRYGYSSLATSQTDQNVRLIAWEKQGGAESLIAVDDQGDIWDYTSTPVESVSTWSSPTSDSDYVIGAASLNNVLYLSRIDEAAQKFDGSSWAAVTATVFDGTASRFPKAKFLASAHSKMFAANVDDGGTLHRSRLHWSNTLDPEKWDAEDYIDFDPDDGQQITALVPFGEELVVFKNHSVQMLAGKSEQSFTRYTPDSQLGTVSPYTVVSMGASLFFFDRDTGVWAFDGSGFTLVSEKINAYLLSGINYSAAYKASAFVYRTKMYLSVPWGSDSVNSRTFVYDQITSAWTQYSYGVADAAHFGGRWYGASAGDAAGVQKLFDTYNDAGAAVVAYVKTGWMAPEGPEAKSRIRRLDMAFTAAAATVTVDMYRDFATAAPYRSQTFTTTQGGSLWDVMVWDVDSWDGGVDQELLLTSGWGERFRAAQFKFSVSDVGEYFQLNRLTLHVSSLGRIRGEA